MKRLLSLALCAALLATPVLAADTKAEAKTGTWVGLVTDTHCGLKGATKDHTAACVEKCMAGGSKAQLATKDGKLIDLDSFAKVKPLMGNEVAVTGTFDATSNTLKVEKAEKAPASK